MRGVAIKNRNTGIQEFMDSLHMASEVLHRHRYLILVYIAALLFDTLSTIYFMNRLGIDLELHPLVRCAAYNYGPVLGPFLSAFLFKLLAGVFLILYLKRYAHYFLKAAIVTAVLAGVYNFWGDISMLL